MQFSVVNKKDLNAEFRIDSEYYKPVNLTIENIVKKHKYELLVNICKLIAGPFGSAVTTDKYDKDSNFRYIRGKDIQSFFVDQNDKIFIQESLFKELAQFHLKERDILVTVVGMKFGKVAIVYPDDCPALFSCKSTLIRNPSVNIFYLATYLSSKYGYRLVRRGQRGAAQPGINLFDLQNIPVPIFSTSFCDEIERLIIKARSCLHNSTNTYSSAERIVLSELGLLNWQPRHKLSFIKNYSDTEKAERIDAEYFQPKYDKIKLEIMKNSCGVLGNYFSIHDGKNVSYIEDGEIGVIKTKQVSDGKLNYQVESHTSLENIIDKKAFILEHEDIIFASMGVGSLGKTAIHYTLDIPDKFTVDSTLKIFRKRKNGSFLPETLLVYLNSKLGQELIYQNIVGSSGIINIYEEYLRKIPIPSLGKNVQQQIRQKVAKSFNLRKQSKHLLECAKRAVEIAIEKSEKEATVWLKAKSETYNV